ncbi:hypothetical protein FAUST_6714 [Fusarium austroamericanum]|uniref:Zn(2)-C6 fungal-type domain-containing protein n=1 Tax=Fusarium austroamericanum TaxID=282268 RepID=A0AAN6BZG7_FUSAU|nr:hypothetical protein FAUST_6714 [Fusarium austroamericanum]
MADDIPNPPAKRSQVPRACQRCKTLRRGCNEYRPCRRCVDAGLADRCIGQSGSPTILQPIHAYPYPYQSFPNTHNGPADALSRLTDLVPSQVLDHCVERFFARLYPTIPILTRDYVGQLRSTSPTSPEERLEAYTVLVAMCAQVLLQSEEPENLLSQGLIAQNNATYGSMIVDQTVAIHQSTPRTMRPRLNQCLVAFFLYACQARLSHHSQTFLFLREATTLFCLLRLDDMDHTSKALAHRLFWVLVISERSHAIRYRRPITLQITDEAPEIDVNDPSLSGFWSLSALFRPIDTSFVALLNQERFAITPPLSSLDLVETAVNTAIKPDALLHETQKANLRITQLWLRMTVWKLRLRLGHLSENAQQYSLTYQYPLVIAKDLTLSTRDLSIDSISIHGIGVTEKLYDIVSAVVDVLARVPVAPSSPQGLAMGTAPEDDLLYIRNLITKLPGGTSTYDPLLEKHIQQALPSPESTVPENSPPLPRVNLQ